MTDEEAVIKHNCGICLFCGKDLQDNAAQIPDCMKVISLILEAYNLQRTIIKGPEVWACFDCAKKIAANSMKHAQKFNDLQ